jgi:hypothetical protein
MTLAVLLAAIAGLIALLLTLSRRQRRHLDRSMEP